MTEILRELLNAGIQTAGCLYRVRLNNRWLTSSLDPVAAITKRYGLSWEID